MFLLILWFAVLLNQPREPRDWMLVNAGVLAVVFGWRLSRHIHMCDAEARGGACFSADAIRVARREQLVASLVRGSPGGAVTLAFA